MRACVRACMRACVCVLLLFPSLILCVLLRQIFPRLALARTALPLRILLISQSPL